MIEKILPILSTVLPIVAGVLIFTLIFINLYFRIRRKFSISVNCWFCNGWSKVLYDNRNSFDCTHCLQYNGFTKDGGYNKVIPEQHDELMNRKRSLKVVKSSASNGLCNLCNNNQQLKVFQLAHFVPLVEENYDVEIEHFQKQLEKAYKLCRKCDNVLKSTIQGQNARIFGNRIKRTFSNSLSSCKDVTTRLISDRNVVLRRIDQGLFFANVLVSVVIFLANSKGISHYFGNYIPNEYRQFYEGILEFVHRSNVLVLRIPYLKSNVKLNCYLGCCAFGVSQVIIEYFLKLRLSTMKMNRLLCWMILILSSILVTRPNWSYLLALQVFCYFYLLYTTIVEEEKYLGPVIKGRTMRKLVKNLEYTCTDFSESASDFENISTSTNSSQRNLGATATSVFNYEPSVIQGNYKPLLAQDLNKSLNNLNLGHLQFKSPSHTSSLINFNVQRPKPVLSPPKLQHINTWVDKGFWKSPDRTNFSRSSSESSGFGSQHTDLPRNYDDRFGARSSFNDMRPYSPYRHYLFQPVELPNSAFYPRSVLSTPIQSPVSFHSNLSPRQAPENWSDRINSQTIQSFRDLSLQPMNN